jgi:hypothetical protein
MRASKNGIIIGTLLSVLLLSSAASAVDCAGGLNGEFKVNAGTLQYCANGAWLGVKNTTPTGTCSNANEMSYTGGHLKVCVSSQWRNTADTAGAVAVCGGSAALAGQFYYGIPSSRWYYCTGTNVYRIEP